MFRDVRRWRWKSLFRRLSRRKTMRLNVMITAGRHRGSGGGEIRWKKPEFSTLAHLNHNSPAFLEFHKHLPICQSGGWRVEVGGWRWSLPVYLSYYSDLLSFFFCASCILVALIKQSPWEAIPFVSVTYQSPLCVCPYSCKMQR